MIFKKQFGLIEAFKIGVLGTAFLQDLIFKQYVLRWKLVFFFQNKIDKGDESNVANRTRYHETG